MIPYEKEEKDLEVVAAGIHALHLHDSHVEIRKKRQKQEFKMENVDLAQREITALWKQREKKESVKPPVALHPSTAKESPLLNK